MGVREIRVKLTDTSEAGGKVHNRRENTTQNTVWSTIVGEADSIS